MKIIGIITARMGSTRLPGKVMMDLAGKPVLEHLVDRVRDADMVEEIVIATSEKPGNEPIVELAERCGIRAFRGKDDDVLDRYVNIMRKWDAENCVRLCADNPLTDMETTKNLAGIHLEGDCDYSCVKGLQLQLGLTEIVSRKALETIYQEAPEGFRRESFTITIREQPDRFKIATLPPDPFIHQSPFRLTLDYEEDMQLLREIFRRLYRGRPIRFREALELLRDHPEIASINSMKEQKQGNKYWEELDAKLP